VLQADGGTRTASITGAFVSAVLAVEKLAEQEPFAKYPVTDFLASVSVGSVDGQLLLDLIYEEDARASIDMNVAMTGSGLYVEVQGTGEAAPFSRAELDEMLALAKEGIEQLIALQKRVLGPAGERIGGVLA